MEIMGVMQTIDIYEPVRERVLELLEKPYAGSKAFRYYHPDSRYVSNCHGTMAYVFGLDDPILEERIHPDVILGNKIQELIARYFLPSDWLGVGNLIGFYETSEDGNKRPFHTAILIGPNDQIFHQSGTGGIFETSTIELKLRSLIALEPKDVEVRSYRLSN